jgi:hypothetical protein
MGLEFQFKLTETSRALRITPSSWEASPGEQP